MHGCKTRAFELHSSRIVCGMLQNLGNLNFSKKNGQKNSKCSYNTRMMKHTSLLVLSREIYLPKRISLNFEMIGFFTIFGAKRNPNEWVIHDMMHACHMGDTWHGELMPCV